MGAAPDVELLARAIRNPGRICMGPSTLSGSFPFGGRDMGLHRNADLFIAGEYQETHDPSDGQYLETGRRSIENLWIDFMIEGPRWDEDFLQAIQANFTKPANLPVTSPPETQILGGGDPTTLTPLPPLLFAADDIENGESIYIPRPIARGLGVGIRLSLQAKCAMPIRIKASGVLNMQAFQVCRFSNMVLA